MTAGSNYVSSARLAAMRWVIAPMLDVVPRLTRGLPHDLRRREGMRIDEDVPYGPRGLPDHALDMIRAETTPQGAPVLVYVHGGGFASCSKNTHISLGLAYARRGFVVANVNYRRSPEHAYPAALEDVALAIEWLRQHAARFGGDPSRIVLAGESAGANLVTALTVAACYPLDHPVSKRLRAIDFRPVAVLAGAGVYQVSQIERLLSASTPAVVRHALFATAEGYLGKNRKPPRTTHLADPLLHLEQAAPDRPLPSFFVFCGTADPLLDDSVRLAKALEQRGADVELRLYPGEPHAFHAIASRPAARTCWADKDAYIAKRGLVPA